jgi:hypothetical protein
MAKRNGGIIGPSNVPTGQYGGTASGVWRLRDAFNYIKAGLWPGFATYSVGNSLRFNAASSDYLDRTPSTTTNRQKATLSFWTKYSDDTSGNVGRLFNFGLYPNGTLIYFGDGAYKGKLLIDSYAATVATIGLVTTQLFRDYSAWYHIVVAFDTTQATASNRVKLYVNGTQVTTFDAAVYPSLNENLFFNYSSSTYQIGKNHQPAYFSGYLAETNMIDGQALTPSSFGQTDSATGIWTPLPFTGTFGTNGFYLKFANSAALGTDSSGNANTFTANNLTSVDQSTDTPTNNFCTMSPLIQFRGAGVSQTYEEGNLQVTSSSSVIDTGGTFAVDKGKWFWEFKCLSSATTNQGVGIVIASAAQNTYSFNASNQYRYMANGNKNGTGGDVAYGASYTTNDIIGVALDCDNGTLIFYKNGASQGTAYTGLTNILFLPILVMYGSGISLSMQINFGSPPYAGGSNTDGAGYGNFSYAVPAGYYSLCTKNLANFG